jgi:hypothetical protein
MLANFNAGFPPLKYVKKSNDKKTKGKASLVSDLNITNILNQNKKPMIVTNKPIIDVIESL